MKEYKNFKMSAKLKFENIWMSPAIKFDPVAVGFVNEAVKEAGYDRALISGAGHDRYLPVRIVC